ncbi:DsbA family protein [uncultured Roseobacter sp.]|uniref:DsbA family protein n=1 Tax=uncultured Roseobacter sp. TaxID=114847 RepID=UPI002603C431|nr:DsbA family protein [uncultured Roseobacter sp.]
MRRRDALVIGGAMAAAIALPPILRRLPSDLDFAPIPDFPGFRRMSGGAVSSGNVALLGLDDRLPAPADPAPPALRNPCKALFGPSVWAPGTVPVAVFSDFNCPYCKTLDERLISLAADDASVRLIWHEMPLLGPGSYRAAKAVIAAGFLGAGERARRYLWQYSLRPGPAALGRMAEALELLPDMLRREFDSARVAKKLAEGLDLGGRLGIPGTPGTVVGRTLVVGAIRPPDLRRLIGIELEEGPLACA